MNDWQTVEWHKSSYSGHSGGDCVEVASLWRKSSYSDHQGGECVEVASLWRKSSYSDHDGGNCVEVADLSPVVGVRDSKDAEGPKLTFGVAAWAAFTRSVKAGELDLT
ncbi:hypothetical protein BJY14_002297 [Actinomadura luteofluorescens]|uniref:DUF397 domain-containing protein n=1 Tax=Actinomadura luteofluorescens TaxID=46163 RepID=A0A7Y9JGG9_9ACTN|nr:DUF397 domain-containing protein [Actinomadura luteofluorescens]NYD46314.1 hypothetical protein [Actinomadura luteofluorescens]